MKTLVFAALLCVLLGAKTLPAQLSDKHPPLLPEQIEFVSEAFGALLPRVTTKSGYVLDALMQHKAKINGVWLGVGEVIGVYKIVQINKSSVLLQGEANLILLKPKEIDIFKTER